MITLLKYKVVREYGDGQRGQRVKHLYRWSDEPSLAIGSLYCHLGRGYPGMQRVISVEKTDIVYDDGA